ncbi:hypothetical protein [Hydrogenophaga sp. 5NK40-0174]|uniref:hypothetical protein n=1 Tax=Hydrogenophaga sp. 5NK40-0174 TaxID=3127649 RepID=UPI00333FE5BA
MSMQLLGILTVVWGLNRTRAEFGQPGIGSQFRDWIKRFPPYPLPKVVATGTTTFPPLESQIHVHSTSGPPQDESVEGRLLHVEKLVRNLESANGRMQSQVLQLERKVERDLETHRRSIAAQVDTVERKIESTATSGVHISAVGVVLLFVGTVLASAAPEIQKLLGAT